MRDSGRASGGRALDELRRQPPRVVVAPTSTVFTVAAAVAGARRSVPSEWISAAHAVLEPADRAALAPIGDGPCPDIAAIADPEAPATVPEALERIATLPEDALLREIEGSHPLSPLWDTVAERPRRWLVLYARALSRIWSVIRPTWAAAADLIDRELERVETAAHHGALTELIGDVHDRAFVREGRWLLPEECRAALGYGDEMTELRVAEDGLRLVPVLTGAGGACLVLPEPGVVASVLYPLPGALRLINGEMPTPGSALESLLGSQRAAILRLLDRPRHAGGLSAALALSPAGVTHHLNALEASGLVLRERDARRVIVHRTGRGTILHSLYHENGHSEV